MTDKKLIMPANDAPKEAEPEGVNVMDAMGLALDAAIKAIDSVMDFTGDGDLVEGIGYMPKTLMAAQNIPVQWTQVIVPAVFANFVKALGIDTTKPMVEEFPYQQLDENIAAMINAAAEFQMQQMQRQAEQRTRMAQSLAAGNAGH